MKWGLFAPLLLVASVATAQSPMPTDVADITSAYRSYKDIAATTATVPTVVEVPFENEFIERLNFAVLDTTTNSFEPYHVKESTVVTQVPITAITDAEFVNNIRNLVDGESTTAVDIPLLSTESARVEITLRSAQPITSSRLTALLDAHVALPSTVEIWAQVAGQDTIVVAPRRMEAQTVLFPKTTATVWKVVFTYSQPLRITELKLVQENARATETHAVRFLAQPAHTYRVYFDPDRVAIPSVGEAGNLAAAKDVVSISGVSTANPNFTDADVDADTVPDLVDNCVNVANRDQQDVNTNGRGDACDDFDQDGYMNSKDNCVNKPNRYQEDEDGDGVGNVCDQEESRITERYAWLPWVGIGFAALVLVGLLIVMVRSNKSPTPPITPPGDTPAST